MLLMDLRTMTFAKNLKNCNGSDLIIYEDGQQGWHIFIGATNQNGKIYPNDQNVYHKTYQRVVNYSKRS
jgi:7-cyano-7-deazaguanine synthase in queuosine biosynthesis